MNLRQKTKNFLLYYNMMRSRHSKLGIMTYQSILIVNALQVTSILAMVPLTAEDRISNTTHDFLGLFALPNLLEVLEIPRYVALLVISPVLTAYFLLSCFFILKRESGSKTHWLINLSLNVTQIYHKLLFIPFLQLAMTELLQNKNITLSIECSKDLCVRTTLALGSLALALTLWFYYLFLYIRVPCYFDDGIEIDNTHLFLDTIKGAQMILVTGLAAASVNIYVVFAIWGISFLLLELIPFILLDRHWDPKIEKTSIVLRGIQITIYATLMLSNILKFSYLSSNSMLIALLFPASTKLIGNLKEIIKERMTIHISKGGKDNSNGIDRYLKALYLEHKNNSSKAPADLALTSRHRIAASASSKPNEERSTKNEKNEDSSPIQHSTYQEMLDQNIVEYVANTYSSILYYPSTNKVNLSIAFSWLLFLKDVKRSFIQAYIMLSQIRKTVQKEGSFRMKLQFELIETIIKAEMTAGVREKTVAANKLFAFLDESHAAQRSIEEYLSKVIEYYTLMSSNTVKATEAKSQGMQLLNARTKIIKNFENLIQENQSHFHTIQLYSFFVRTLVEEKSRSKLFEINRNLLLNNFSKHFNLNVEEKWDMSLEFYSNALADKSGNYVAVLNLNSSNLGQIMRLSDNLLSLLDFSKEELSSLTISALEPTLFNRKNLKHLQELLLQEDDPFEKVPEKEKVVYLKNKSGRVLAFHYAAYLEIYDGNPCLVAYLRLEPNTDHNFVIFNLRKEGKIIGIGEGLSAIFDDQVNRFSTVYEMVPGFPIDFTEKSCLLFVQGVPINHLNTNKVSVNSIQSFTQLDGVLFDYVASVHHISIVGKSYGILSLSSSFFKKATSKSMIKFSEIKVSIALSETRKQTKNLKFNSEVSSGVEPLSPSNFLLLQKNKEPPSKKESVRKTEPQVLKTSKSGIASMIQTDQVKLEEAKRTVPKISRVNVSGFDRIDEANPIKFDNKDDLDENAVEISPVRLKPHHFTLMSKENTNPIVPSSSDHSIVENSCNTKEAKIRIAGADARTSTRASTAAAHLTFLRYAILEKGNPTVIKTVYFSSAIIFATGIICTLVIYSLLMNQYTTFSGFATHAAFSGMLKLFSSSLFLSTELRYAAQLGQFTSANTQKFRSSSTTIATNQFTEFLSTVSTNLINFDPDTLTSNLKLSNYTMLIQFPESSVYNIEANFYEINNVFMAYAQQINLIPSTATTINIDIVNFMRTFTIEYQHTILDPTRTVLFTDAYDQYYNILDVLNYVLIACSLLILALTLSFYFVFREFEKMETQAISKLCGVSKEDLGREIRKIIEEYQIKFNPDLQLSRLLESHFQPSKGKKNTGHTTTRVGRKIIGDDTPKLLIVVCLLLAAVLLSAYLIVLNTVSKSKTNQILPYLIDIDMISAGVSAYVIVYSALFRLVNEVQVKHTNETLANLFRTYQPSLDESLEAHQNLMTRFRNFDDRILDTDITSNETKGRYLNLTNDGFCANRYQNGSNQAQINTCLGLLNNIASQGLPDTATLVITTDLASIQQYEATPTLQVVQSILQASDSYDFDTMTTTLTWAIQYLLESEQVDVSGYANSLVQATTTICIISLCYSIVITIVIWIPVIRYLKRRFWIARNIFLLYPIRVLQSNENIKQLFKKW